MPVKKEVSPKNFVRVEILVTRYLLPEDATEERIREVVSNVDKSTARRFTVKLNGELISASKFPTLNHKDVLRILSTNH